MNKNSAFGFRIRWRIRWMTAALLASASTGAAVAQANTVVAKPIHGDASTHTDTIIATPIHRAAPASRHTGPVDPALARVAAEAPSKRVTVIVQFRKSASAEQAYKLISHAHGIVTDRLPAIHGLAATVTARGGVSLGAHADVRSVTLNASVIGEGGPGPAGPAGPGAPAAPAPPGQQFNLSQLQSTWDQAINAQWAWNQPQQYTGQGIGVAVIDSGVDGNLPDFQVSQSNTTSRVIASAVINPNATSADDPYGHGTMVAGIIAGNGLDLPSSNSLYGQYIGVAPNANIIAIKVGDDQGNTSELDVINGIQFAIDNQATYNIRVINLSLESDTAQSYTTDPLDAAVQAAINAGITVVVSAGNLGNVPGAVDYAPGNDPNAIVVGAISDQQTQNAMLQSLTQQNNAAEQAMQQSDQQAVQALQQANQAKEQAKQQSDQQAQQALQQSDQAKEQALQQSDQTLEQSLQGPARNAQQQTDQQAQQALQQSDKQAEQALQQSDQQAEQAMAQSDQQAVQALQQSNQAKEAAEKAADQAAEQALQGPGNQIASWSSRGVTQDGISEPDIYAPGAHIVSLLAPNSEFQSLCPQCILGNDQYIRASGTSFAAPVVSGAVADMLQANPNLTPAQVKADVVASAAPLPGQPPAGPGQTSAGEIQLDKAIQAATQPAGPAGPAGPGGPANGNGNGSRSAPSNSSWGSPSFSSAPSNLTAGWARSSWSCASCTGNPGSAVGSSRSSWSRSSWSVESTD